MTGAGWNDILNALLIQPPDCDLDYKNLPYGNCGNPTLATLYLVSFIVLSSMIVINMYIAVLLENFKQAHHEEELGLGEEDLERFYAKWSRSVRFSFNFPHLFMNPFIHSCIYLFICLFFFSPFLFLFPHSLILLEGSLCSKREKKTRAIDDHFIRVGHLTVIHLTGGWRFCSLCHYQWLAWIAIDFMDFFLSLSLLAALTLYEPLEIDGSCSLQRTQCTVSITSWLLCCVTWKWSSLEKHRGPFPRFLFDYNDHHRNDNTGKVRKETRGKKTPRTDKISLTGRSVPGSSLN